MSSKLPREIWIRIFIQLHQADQMECMLVCRYWNQIIEHFTLYQTVFIYSATSTAKLIEKIQQRPEIANKIEKLKVAFSFRLGDQEILNYFKLLSSLTNLKALYSSMATFLDGSNLKHLWCKKIKHITNWSHDAMICRVLLSNTCPSLTTLEIVHLTSDTLPIFKNTPALTSLTIHECEKISFDQLEMMHQSLPHLNSLRVRSITSGSFNFDESNAISAATLVTECQFGFDSRFHNFNIITRLLEYITIKYPSLTRLRYDTDRLSLSPLNLQMIRDINWTPLFQKLGSQLKHLCLVTYEYYQQLFGILDSTSCTLSSIRIQLLTCTLLEKMASSQQVLYLQTIVLINSKCGSFHWLKELRVLRKLKLVNCRYSESVREIQLNDIIDNAPSTLESLSLKILFFAFDPDYTGISNIKTLSFSYTHICGIACDFFSKCFPRLSTLKMKYCQIQGMSLRLTKTNLRVFHYVACYYGDNNSKSILIVTLRNNEQRLYHLMTHTKERIQESLMVTFSPQDYFPYKSYSIEKVNNPKSSLLLICNSLGRVIL